MATGQRTSEMRIYGYILTTLVGLVLFVMILEQRSATVNLSRTAKNVASFIPQQLDNINENLEIRVDNVELFPTNGERKDIEIDIKVGTHFRKISLNEDTLTSIANEHNKMVNNSEMPGTGFLKVILTFPLLIGDFINGSSMINSTKVERMQEYMDCLKAYLDNKYVLAVHLLYDDPNMPYFIYRRLKNRSKLLLVRVEDATIAYSLHRYAFNALKNELVMITQADIKIGDGFEKINRTLLESRRLMYALSRQDNENATCRGAWQNMCSNFVGSHDSFIFVPQGNLTEYAVAKMSNAMYNWGIENLVLYVYKYSMHYHIINPCKILKIHHVHCSGYRPHERIRVNNNGLSYYARPTDKLT